MCVVGEGEKEANVIVVHVLIHSIQHRYRGKCHANARYCYDSQPVRQCDFNFSSPSLVSSTDLLWAVLLGQQFVAITHTLSPYKVPKDLMQWSTPKYLLNKLGTGRTKLEEK